MLIILRIASCALFLVSFIYLLHIIINIKSLKIDRAQAVKAERKQI